MGFRSLRERWQVYEKKSTEELVSKILPIDRYGVVVVG